jgi:hypothetical protein
MDHTTMISHAQTAASDVLSQWTGVDINWSDVRAELDSHWGAEQANLEEAWTGSDEHNYRNLVAREIERRHAKRSAEVSS